ncbi:hypothetical protein [Microbispora sp. NBRC 16548]|uniref:hypothetical protein n=1 Tax=Microbispora sp. NBRC 16548 TaxID=3030994 RepID=UPI0024A1B803|nr:hypothetical protein [Microbispora sp. NBRC 16548]GLX11634.1 hypothetical protein Misp03_85600 [Microbispora sp. NBRC 16548]
MDPDNAVVRLCTQGMQAEAEGRDTDARNLFQQAWEIAADDYEACIAAHYLARHQSTPQQTLHWNQECLNRADLVGDDRVKGFYASLHVNMAKAYRDLGEPERAREHFELAATHIDEVPPGQYADWTRVAIAEGLRSTGASRSRDADALLTALFARFCERGDLKALGLVLPAYLTDLGTEDDRARLTTALHMVHAARWLPEDEQHILSEAISTLTSAATAG